METRAKVTTGAALPCEVELEAGGTTRVVVFDQAGDLSDGQAGPTSTQAVSAALASCTAVTLRVYAERKGWSLEGLEVEVTTTYEGPNPNLFTVSIGWPSHLDEEQVERLARIAGKCPVHRLLTESTSVEIETA
ncbi:MAG: OsmC family protein [Solirubrobacterales bacterium]